MSDEYDSEEQNIFSLLHSYKVRKFLKYSTKKKNKDKIIHITLALPNWFGLSHHTESKLC